MILHHAMAALIVLIFIPFALTKMEYFSIEDHVYLYSNQINHVGLRVLGTRCPKLTYLRIFVGLFLFRYARMIVNMWAYWAYKPTSQSGQPTLFNSDVTFIVTTIDPRRPSFTRTVSNILVNRPAKLMVALAGKDIDWKPLADCLCYRNLEVLRLSGAPSKRLQMMAALTKVKTPIVAFVDDRVYVPETFLQFMLPPLEDPKAGAVTPAVLTQRFDHGVFSWAGFWNFIGCLYIIRRNFDRQAINTVDGGISTVPGRAFLIRSEIMQDPDYIHNFLNEYMEFPFIGKIGPVNTGEDTFTTRWLYRKGWQIKVQHCPEATVETDNLGVYPRFRNQLSRWSRSSIRSRVTQMSEGWNYISQYPWTFYTVNIQCLTNFPLFVDGTLIFTLYKGVAMQEPDFIFSTRTATMLFLCWLMSSKLIKLLPHFRRHPWDILYFPFYILFVYYHTFHRLHAVMTIGNDSWAGRNNLDDFAPGGKAQTANSLYKDGKYYHTQHRDGAGEEFPNAVQTTGDEVNKSK